MKSISIKNTSCKNISDESGPLAYPLTNDYMFRALLQRNNKVLKGLICSLLHLEEEQVISVTIENPIELGNSIDNKSFYLDVKVCLNNRTNINLEMQVINAGDWTERSLSYLCRAYDNLYRGRNYSETKAAIHIGFLDFTLFSEKPEFYGTYWLLNEKNHNIYTDKFRLSVIDLTQIPLATEEDKSWNIHYWASFFKATTWEEIKMLAAEHEIINEATQTMRTLSADEKIRLQCEAREEYNRTMNYYKKMEEDFKSKEKAFRELEKAIKEKENALKEKENALKEKEGAIKEKDSAIKEKDSAIKEKDSAIKEKDSSIKEKDSAIEEKEQIIKEKNDMLKKQEAEIEKLKKLLAEQKK